MDDEQEVRRSPSQLDPESQRFQNEVDAVVRRWAKGDDVQYRRRWKQLGNWSNNRTGGVAIKKDKLRSRLYEETGGRCQRCGQEFQRGALTLHRVDTTLNFIKAENMGYTRKNVLLVCNLCHQQLERERVP